LNFTKSGDVKKKIQKEQLETSETSIFTFFYAYPEPSKSIPANFRDSSRRRSKLRARLPTHWKTGGIFRGWGNSEPESPARRAMDFGEADAPHDTQE
jgi:hypothetical protein